MTRVFIVATTLAMRAGLRALLASPTIQVVGEAVTLAGYRSDLAAADVILVGDEALLAETARALPGDTARALVALSDDVRSVTLLRTLLRGGWGIVAPESDSAELQAAVVAAAQGLIVLPPHLAEQALSQRSAVEVTTLIEPLTPREREVLELISQGLPNKLIASQLQISEHTVKFHVSALFAKLGANSRTEAVSLGARQGLISL